MDKTDEIQNIPYEKAKYIRKHAQKMIKEILEQAENDTYVEYKRSLKSVGESIDSFNIQTISDYFNRDIYFIDGKNRMPYNNSSTTENFHRRKSIIILWVNDNHYEVIGRLIKDNRIQREFDHDDPLVKKIYTVLVQPTKVAEVYPDLTAYLPKEYRDNDNINDSMSENSDYSMSRDHQSENSDYYSEDDSDSYHSD